MLKKQQFNIYLPPELIRQVKHKAIDLDQSLSNFVEEALINHIERLAAKDQDHESAVQEIKVKDQSLELMALLHSSDLEGSLNFYRTLGFTLCRKRKRWSELRLGGALLGLHAGDPWVRGEQIRMILISHVPLEKVVKQLKANGVRVENEIADEAYGRSLIIHDPDGFTIMINEYDPELYP